MDGELRWFRPVLVNSSWRLSLVGGSVPVSNHVFARRFVMLDLRSFDEQQTRDYRAVLLRKFNGNHRVISKTDL